MATDPGTILIADDDLMLLDVVSTQLRDAGWKVKEAQNGKEALDIIGRYRIDALILDIRMPELDGYEVCLELFRRGQKIPTLVMTGCPDEREPLSYLNVRQFMCKPVGFEDLLAFVENSCASRAVLAQ